MATTPKTTGVIHAAQLQTNFSGIEDMAIDCSNSQVFQVVVFEQTYGCWIKSVKIRKSRSYGVFFYDSLQGEMRNCTIDELLNVGSNGSGLIFQNSAGCLIEDNIIYRCFPLMEINYGSCGNVFGYNFCEDSSAFWRGRGSH